MKTILTVGLAYSGDKIDGVQIENLGLCKAKTSPKETAFPLYEYDVIIINPQSYSHFIFGKEGEFSSDPNELSSLKRKNDSYDLDSAFDYSDRQAEMTAAIEAGATVIWCLSETKRTNFYGYRETHLGYVNPRIEALVKRGSLTFKRGRRLKSIDPDSPFTRYFDVLAKTEWNLCLADTEDLDGFQSICTTPEGYSLGGRVALGATCGWVVTPPTSQEAQNQLVRDSLSIEKHDPIHEKYHGLFLSHTGVDKPFVRRLREDLMAHGVQKVWLDEAEIDIGDSLVDKIEEGIKVSRYIAVVLSSKSINAPWVRKELDVAMNREIARGEVVVLPLLYEKCELPEFLRGKLYADFTDPKNYEEVLAKLLRRLRIG
jgi:hypothetical protein